MIKTFAYPRASIAGNPSDGFWGKCVSITFSNYHAECIIKDSKIFIIKNKENILEFKNKKDLLNLNIETNKLALAAIKTFFEFCKLNNINYPEKRFYLETS